MTLAVVLLGLVDGFKFAALSDLTLRASPPGHERVHLRAAVCGDRGVGRPRLLVDAFGLSVPPMTAVAAVAAVAAMLGHCSALRAAPDRRCWP